MIKKSLLIFILLLYIISLLYIKNITSNNNYVIKLDEFYKLISTYSSFNKEYINNYYDKYLETNNIIYSLNLVNYPSFFEENNIYSSFDFDSNIFVNKSFTLSNDYIPNNLIPITLPKINRKNEIMQITKTVNYYASKMFKEASRFNLNLIVYSGYRSYHKQEVIFSITDEKNYVAKPGSSEHQTGYALDIATLDSGLTDFFINTKEYVFLIDNAYKYGFILRYPKSKETITKYPYECWHFRYVGCEIAKIIYEENLCLEEYIYKYVELNYHK